MLINRFLLERRQEIIALKGRSLSQHPALVQPQSRRIFMKLQQLRYICEVRRYNLNVTHTAERLFTSQPGISKQIRLLEDELGTDIFVRSGKQFVGVTPAGELILQRAEGVLASTREIRKIAEEFRDPEHGELSLATTHTQARYLLPPAIQKFRLRHPKIRLTLHQGTPAQITEMVSRGEADLAIATEGTELFDNLIRFPCYRWNRSVIVPEHHPLTTIESLSLEALAKYPLVTYTHGFTGRSQLDAAFEVAGLKPEVVLTAVDADVIKTYVRLGLGVGIVAHMAFDPSTDTGLRALEAAHLFAPSVTRIVIRKDTYFRQFLFDFIEMVAPHLDRVRVEEALALKDQTELEAYCSALQIPLL